MSQLVQFQQFNLKDLQTEAGVAKLNQFLTDIVSQIHAMQGTVGPIRPDANIDMGGKYKVINQAT